MTNQQLEEQKIIETVGDIFTGADERDWERVERAFVDEVLLDYTSMVGGEPAVLKARQIVENWKNLLPGFEKTHHQLSDFQIQIEGETADARFKGHAEHLIGDEIWIVDGGYETELVNKNGVWLISKHKLNLTKQDGNLELPKLAGERIAEKK